MSKCCRSSAECDISRRRKGKEGAWQWVEFCMNSLPRQTVSKPLSYMLLAAVLPVWLKLLPSSCSNEPVEVCVCVCGGLDVIQEQLVKPTILFDELTYGNELL